MSTIRIPTIRSTRPPIPHEPGAILPIKMFVGHTNQVSSIAFLNNGTRIISGSRDVTVRTWDVEQAEETELPRLAHDFEVESMAVTSDKRTLICGLHVTGKCQIVSWDLVRRKVKWKTEVNKGMDGWCVALSPDGRLLAGRCREQHKLYPDDPKSDWAHRVMLLDVESGRQAREPLENREHIQCLVFSPDGTRLAMGSFQGKVRVFDVATGETALGPFTAHRMTVLTLAFTHDGQQIITTSYDYTVRVWNSTTGEELGNAMVGHRDAIWQIVLSADGRRLASVSGDRTVRVWDMRTRQQLGGPLQPRRPTQLCCVVWSPDDRSVVAGDCVGDIHLWTAPPLAFEDSGDVTAPAPNAPPTPRSHADSLSSSILNLPAGASPTPPQSPSPELNSEPGEDDNWEYYTNDSDSFDSVLDLPADGSQPAQRRKRRRRRRVAPTRPPFSLPAPLVPNVAAPPVVIEPSHRQPPPVVIDPPHRPLPPQLDQAPNPPARTTPAADVPTSRAGASRRLWTLSRWTRRKPGKNRDESQPVPVDPSSAPNSLETHRGSPSRHREVHSSPEGTAPKSKPTPTILTRLRALVRSGPRRRSQKQNTTSNMENVEMRPPRGRNPPPRTRTRRQSAVVDVATCKMDQRLAASSNKWTDEIDWLDYICFCMCCPWNKRASDSDSERSRGRRDVNAAGTGSGSDSGSEVVELAFDPNNTY
ncbi:quinon protein alcohol dehydrogenase-like superfamily [Hygrophoropsis aurantiaca]|uniref:Quinon protein alcohol dehydrogenase-like superfamily n=1 Tax=Hygrophoropsis aurantiaca TaxID=72124 RepID=A0ACB8A0Y2_9AGAM|nr:quinon protein alcohol dehydrogenase-like superfamily [Hygrophoropsis aurantiaca]